MSIVLAADLGSTTFRMALVDSSGTFIADHSRPAAAATGDHGWSELDAGAWWTAFLAGAMALEAKAPAAFRQIAGIAICGATRTQVLVDAAGNAVRPAIGWADSRAEEGMAAVRALLPQDHPELEHLNAFHPAARLHWLVRHEPAICASAVAVLDPKDFLNLKLTGRAASDRISMARLSAAAGAGPDGVSLLDAMGAGARLLPRLFAPTDTVGPVLSGLPQPLDQLSGKPVFACANDTWAAVLGLGALRPGFAYNISGTTEVFGVLSRKHAAAEGLLSVRWGDLHQLGGPGQNGADTLRWLVDMLEPKTGEGGFASTVERLLDLPRDPQPLLFLPSLNGERVPWWDPALRGAFVGLTRNHGPGDMAWAVLEGIACLNRVVLERAEDALGETIREIRFGGGGASNTRWRQVKADMLHRPVAVCETPEPGLTGAAAAAFTGLGVFTSLEEAQERLVRIRGRSLPDTAKAAFCDDLFTCFIEAHQALVPVSHAVSRLKTLS